MKVRYHMLMANFWVMMLNLTHNPYYAKRYIFSVYNQYQAYFATKRS